MKFLVLTAFYKESNEIYKNRSFLSNLIKCISNQAFNYTLWFSKYSYV